MLGLPLRMELTLQDCLIYQLGRELNYHRSRQNDLKDQLSKWVEKSTEQARRVKEPVNEKRELTETFQDKLKELKKAIEDTYGLHDVIRES